MGESKTGSGKTHTFLLPIFQTLNEDSQQVEAVITAPSRELATQIYQAARQIASHSEKRDSIVIMLEERIKAVRLKKLQVKQPHIVIGTPGGFMIWLHRVIWLFIRPILFVVDDEADMTLDMGFLSTVDKIAQVFRNNCNFSFFQPPFRKNCSLS